MAAYHQDGANKAFNVSSGETMTVARLAIEISGNRFTLVHKAFGEGIRPAQREVHTRIPDTAKAERPLGLENLVSIH